MSEVEPQFIVRMPDGRKAGHLAGFPSLNSPLNLRGKHDNCQGHEEKKDRNQSRRNQSHQNPVAKNAASASCRRSPDAATTVRPEHFHGSCQTIQSRQSEHRGRTSRHTGRHRTSPHSARWPIRHVELNLVHFETTVKRDRASNPTSRTHHSVSRDSFRWSLGWSERR